jgi:transposase
MHGATIRLDAKEQKRAWVLNQVLEGALTGGEAAALLGLSTRQRKRLKAAYRRDGPSALVHGNRGRPPWPALPVEVRQRVVALAREKYAGLNHQHLTEKLAEDEELPLHRTTVRRLLLAAGVASPRPRRGRRERLPREGMLLQADGSPHRWLGPAHPPLTLVAAIDDATGTVPWAVFREQEDAAGYLLLLRAVVTAKGVPLAL